MARRIAAILCLTLIISLSSARPSLHADAVDADAGSMAAMIIDMDPEDGNADPNAFVPANQPLSFGAIQRCARIDDNNLLDQDEDTVGSPTLASGLAESATPTTLSDTAPGPDWPADKWSGLQVVIVSGKGSGQSREIVTNTSDTLTVSPPWGTIPDGTSSYEIRVTWDVVSLDLLAEGIPTTAPMQAWQTKILYDEANLTVVRVWTAPGFMVDALPMGQPFTVNDYTPDADGNGSFTANATDISFVPETSETGDGTLGRLAISADWGAPAGIYTLTIDPSMSLHVSAVNNPHAPKIFVEGQIAVNTPCPATTDADGDGAEDTVESGCGSNPGRPGSIPERIDGAFAGTNDDGDTQIDEPLPAGAGAFDCDGDGYNGAVEGSIYAPSTQGDQDPCGTNNSPPTDPPSPIGWPADLAGGAFSAAKVNVQDLGSYLGPVRHVNTNVGNSPGDARWDVVPGPGPLGYDINLIDMGNIASVRPSMLSGVRAFNGPPCPWPP